MKAFELPIKKNKLESRADLQLAMKQIGDPLKSCYSEGFAHLHIGNTSAAYPDAVAGMEGFSRVLWGLVPLLAGGEAYDLWDSHLQGIINGTNPLHKEYWGDIHDYDQRMVEMAALGLALALIPEKIWDPLNDEEKKDLSSWLKQINGHPVHDCNWLFFQVLVNLGLKGAGTDYSREIMEQNLNRIDEFYLTDGWYADGIDGHADYYVPFAIHFYGLIYAKLMGKEDPVRAERYKERAKLFAHQFIYWSTRDGAMVPYGRSLTYRFAQAGFWSALAFAEVEVFPYGIIKGLIMNHLRWWFQQPIFNRDGTLSIGYRYPNLIMGENYNSPGSPYWGLKTFLILALKENHPFWLAEEDSIPSLKETSVQKPAHLTICRQEDKNHVLAFNSGHRSTNEHTHTSAKYEKFVYSNYFGFSVPRAEWGLEQGAFDSMLALSEEDNFYRVKRKCEEYGMDGGLIYTKWMPWSDVEVQTWLIPGAPWHVRVHRITTKRPLHAAEGGFAIGRENIHSSNNKDAFIFRNGQEAFACYSWGTSGIKVLNDSGKPMLVYPNADTNLMHSRTVIPTIKSELSPGTSVLVSAIFGEPGEVSEDSWQAAPYAQSKGGQLLVYRKDGKVLLKKNFENAGTTK